MELLVFIHNLCKKENQLQPPGEPREHRLGEVLQGRSKSNFNIILHFVNSGNIINKNLFKFCISN